MTYKRNYYYIWRKGKLIDSAYGYRKGTSPKKVRRELIEYGGFDDDILVTKRDKLPKKTLTKIKATKRKSPYQMSFKYPRLRF